MIEPKKRKARGQALERTFVALPKVIADKVAKYLQEALLRVKGVSVSKTEFVCWFLDTNLEKISEEDLQGFRKKFQNEEGRLKWALQELKRRQAAGESPTLEEILKLELSSSNLGKRPRHKKKSDATSVKQSDKKADDGSNVEFDDFTDISDMHEMGQN